MQSQACLNYVEAHPILYKYNKTSEKQPKLSRNNKQLDISVVNVEYFFHL